MARNDDGTLRLALADERPPWLEGEDEDGDPGLDTARVLKVALACLVLLLALAALGWWLIVGPGEAAPEADGSVIAAPATPYKTRPADPGGRTVQGTGDTSFQVAEGRQVEARIVAANPPTPAPLATDAPPAGMIGVQIGAYPTKEAAEAGWSGFATRLEVLQGRSHRVLQGAADSGTVYRLQVVAGSTEEARALCDALRHEGGDCQVKR